MIEFKGAAALRGYVRAVFSARVRGYAVPVDLVRAQLSAVEKNARRRRLLNALPFLERNEGRIDAAHEIAARIRAAFADYLVTDSDDAELRALEIEGGGAVAPFVDRRAEHSPALDRLAVTGGVSGLAAGVVMRSQSEGDEVRLTGWHLDAPGYMAAGGMRRIHSELFADDGFAAPMLWGRP